MSDVSTDATSSGGTALDGTVAVARDRDDSPSRERGSTPTRDRDDSSARERVR